MKSILQKKFGMIQQQNVQQMAVTQNDSLSCGNSMEASCNENVLTYRESVISNTDCVAVTNQCPENVKSGTRVFICIFSTENPDVGNVFYLWKYPKNDLTCENLLIFPFLVYSGQGDLISVALDEIRSAFPIVREGFSGHSLYDDNIVLFFSTDFVERKAHDLSMFPVTREEVENLGHVHGWSVHDSVRSIMQMSSSYLGGVQLSTSLRVFYRLHKDFSAISHIEPLVRPDKRGINSCDERLVCFVGKTKYVFPSEKEDPYGTIWKAWKRGYDSVYIGGHHGNLWFLRDGHRACSLSVV